MIKAHKTIRDKSLLEPYKLWINQHPQLNGREHKFTYGNFDEPTMQLNWTLRGYRLDIFFVEAKTFGSDVELNGSQRASYAFNHQIYKQMDGQRIPFRWRKTDEAKPVLANYLGTHLWRLSGNVPTVEEWLDAGDHFVRASDEMWWDGNPVDAETIVDIFRFKQDPYLKGSPVQCHHGLAGGCWLCQVR